MKTMQTCNYTMRFRCTIASLLQLQPANLLIWYCWTCKYFRRIFHYCDWMYLMRPFFRPSFEQRCSAINDEWKMLFENKFSNLHHKSAPINSKSIEQLSILTHWFWQLFYDVWIISNKSALKIFEISAHSVREWNKERLDERKPHFNAVTPEWKPICVRWIKRCVNCYIVTLHSTEQ